VEGSKGKEILGWQPNVDFKNGVRMTIDWHLEKWSSKK
jgi:dTDP-D-glucose 4,6-dehydratase